MSHYAPTLERAPRADLPVGLWLLISAAMIFAMAVIGAITRLTESGLSIMEWAPVTGTLPPLDEAEWQRLFDLYRTIPEYQEINRGMSLAQFKEIFWWEWIHRLWGRLIGVVFLLPFLWFLLRRRLDRALVPHLAALFLLGGLQGALGWYMVASGFAERVDVSQYRLAAHLSLALFIYVYMLWTAFRVLAPSAGSRDPGALRPAAWAFSALLALTVVSGAFVAGLNAGLTYNTFPLMDGRLVPRGYAMMEPFWLNWFENVTAVQFNHRLLAVTSVACALPLWLWSLRQEEGAVRRAGSFLALAACAQLALGIAALLSAVPVWLGALHQAGAITLLTATVWLLFTLRPR